MKKLLLTSLVLAFVFSLSAQDKIKNDTLVFTTIKENKVTPVKNQANSGTCWSYSGLAFFESELLRIGKPEVDLSEMFVVSHSYMDKADKYVRMHGTINFAGGGSFYDVWYVLKNYGIVPQAAMEGLNYGTKDNNHDELDATTRAFVDAIVKDEPNKKLTTAWKTAFDGIVNAYLGECSANFTYNGKSFSPESYMNSLGLNMDDYVSITSFTHHPFYTQFAIEIPDNWRWGMSYNLPLEEFSRIFDYAVNNGYTIAWGSDVSEKGFTSSGVAMMPETNDSLVGSDQAKWLAKEKKSRKYSITKPLKEITVTQETRQKAFDNYETTDDHGMLLYGIAKDQDGNEYYMIKNSWGTDNPYKGTWYISKAFVLDKTINIFINKNAIPKDIRKKLGI